MKLSTAVESKWSGLTQKMQNLSSGGGSIFLEAGYPKAFYGKEIGECTQKVTIKHYETRRDLNLSWLSGELDIADRVAIEKKDFYTLPESVLNNQAREQIEPSFAATTYEGKIFIVCSDSTIKQGEFESVSMKFSRDGSVAVQIKYCHRNRFFLLKDDEIAFDLEDEAYLYMMDKETRQSSLQNYEYTSEIVDLMDKKFYIEYCKESKMYIPGKIESVMSIEVDPIDEDAEYVATVLSKDNKIIQVIESLMFLTTKDAVAESIRRNNKEK